MEQLWEEPDPAASGLTETVRKCFDYDFKPLPDNSLPESTACGYYRGQAIAYDDALFDPKPEDRLPEETYPGLQNLGIWREGEGYVLLRCHRMEDWKLKHPVMSYTPRYSELILSTAGDERGFTTCLSASAKSLRYRLSRVMRPQKRLPGFLDGQKDSRVSGCLFLLQTLQILSVQGHIQFLADGVDLFCVHPSLVQTQFLQTAHIAARLVLDLLDGPARSQQTVGGTGIQPSKVPLQRNHLQLLPAQILQIHIGDL